ncbi:glycosyltransferase, partial [Nocardioides kribbensis]|uniref:glycosyltransferase n=1 Tax=Nocardioides kribbensis TaxID=305517 RepID=UPI0032DB7E25
MSSTSTGPADPLGSGTGSRGEAHTASHGGAATGSATGSAAGPAGAGDGADRPTTPPLRCVVVTPYATLGGSERWLLALLDGAAARLDAEVWLLEDGPLRAELERRDVPTLVLPTGPDARSLAARGADLARRLRAGAADVLLANGVKAAAAAVPAARLVGVPVVWAKHDFSFDSTLARPLGALADAVLATSAAVAAATGRDDAVLVP